MLPPILYNTSPGTKILKLSILGGPVLYKPSPSTKRGKAETKGWRICRWMSKKEGTPFHHNSTSR